DVHCPADALFDTIVDLRGYGRWLTPSTAYAGTTDISPEPVAAGTTYVESVRTGVRQGTVTEFEPPTRVTFHQPMTLTPRLLGVIDILVRYTLTPAADSVHVSRDVTLSIPLALKPMQPYVVRQFRREGARTLSALKAFA